jgi:hypothetical protein
MNVQLYALADFKTNLLSLHTYTYDAAKWERINPDESCEGIF